MNKQFNVTAVQVANFQREKDTTECLYIITNIHENDK